MADIKEEVVRRLHTVQGHVAGLARMVEKEEECATILHQLAAVRSALYKITEMVLVVYAEDCLERLPQENQGDRSNAQELVHLLCQFLK